ncbi:unnamed protein product [Haemonchus placei]|uniref:Uncharacterized protein n=1 Tax=Haemonchus placei TaxID=6290 RepID=A0A0N4WEY0_HAEPC|nr:unnamed protein product [Haemonchus placei]
MRTALLLLAIISTVACETSEESLHIAEPLNGWMRGIRITIPHVKKDEEKETHIITPKITSGREEKETFIIKPTRPLQKNEKDAFEGMPLRGSLWRALKKMSSLKRDLVKAKWEILGRLRANEAQITEIHDLLENAMKKVAEMPLNRWVEPYRAAEKKRRKGFKRREGDELQLMLFRLVLQANNTICPIEVIERANKAF